VQVSIGAKDKDHFDDPDHEGQRVEKLAVNIDRVAASAMMPQATA
jgi:hypothetical protein